MKLFAILSLFIVSLVLTTSNFSYIPFLKGTAYAANSMYLEQSKKELKTGETVNVTVKASIDKQFNTAQVDVTYTKESLKLQTVKVGDALPQVAFEQTDPGLVSYSLYKIGGASGQELTLLTLSFENIGGDSEVSFNKTSRLLEAGEVVAYGTGTIKISNASVVTQSEVDPLPKPIVKAEVKTTPLPEPVIKEEPKEMVKNSTKVETQSTVKEQNKTTETSVVTNATNNDNSEQDSSNSNASVASTQESTTTSGTQTTESNTATNSEPTQEKSSEELPNTGPSNIIGLTGLVTLIGYLINNLRLKYSLK